MTDTPYVLSRCDAVTRRRFLSALGASVAVASAGAYGISVWGGRPDGPGIPTATAGNGSASGTTSTSPPAGATGARSDRTLVVIEMGGGNDGLNMVVPYGDSRYYDLRGDLGISSPIELDNAVGLHPSLEFIGQRFAAGEVAIVEGIGYPDPDLSHFASMANWWSGYPDGSVTTGWLGRYLDGATGTEDPLAAVTIGPGPTPALLAERAFQVSIQDMSGLSPRIPEWIDTRRELVGLWQGFAPAAFDGTATLDLVRQAIAITAAAQTTVNDLLGAPGISSPVTTVGRQRSDLEQSVDVAAALVTSAIPPKVVYIHGWGDFDTHEGQQTRHEEMMQQLDAALQSLFTAIDTAGVADRTVVMTTSEFGRRPAFNGSGTDHGTAGSHFVIGKPVAGGRHGTPASLSNLDDRGNLIHTVDYRQVYASILDGWLGSSAEDLLGAQFETLPLFTA